MLPISQHNKQPDKYIKGPLREIASFVDSDEITNVDKRVVESFGEEWSKFAAFQDGDIKQNIRGTASRLYSYRQCLAGAATHPYRIDRPIGAIDGAAATSVVCTGSRLANARFRALIKGRALKGRAAKIAAHPFVFAG